MANSYTFTEAGTKTYSPTPGAQAGVAMQGDDAEDFVWQIEFSGDSGTTWDVYTDSADNSSFTGSAGKIITAVTEDLRINVTDMGAASNVISTFTT